MTTQRFIKVISARNVPKIRYVYLIRWETLCPYGIAYQRLYGLSVARLFKKFLLSPLWGQKGVGGVLHCNMELDNQ